MTDNTALADLHPSIHAPLAELVAAVQEHFGERLVGMYVYGSAVLGDFDPGVSDLDVTVILTDDANQTDLDHLASIHDRIADRHPDWRHRIETQYISRAALATFRERESRMINISPGEPIHFIPANRAWLLNWYFIRDHGLALVGASPHEVIPPISAEEFVAGARDGSRAWRGRVANLDGSQGQSYAILTNCRALYTHRTGRHASKVAAARWAAEAYPAWREAITDAVTWRSTPSFPSHTTAARARALVLAIIDLIDKETNASDAAS